MMVRYNVGYIDSEPLVLNWSFVFTPAFNGALGAQVF
jgi:hypothetical protein